MNRFAGLTLGALLASTSLGSAQSFNDQIISDLKGQGFEFIEIKTGLTQVKVEAIRGAEKLEVIYDKDSGRILKEETEAADGDEIGRSGVEIDERDRDFLDADDARGDDDDDEGDDRDDREEDDHDDNDDHDEDHDDDDDDDEDDNDDDDDDNDDDEDDD